MYSFIFDNIRRDSPLVHSITNYVTANDVANAVLAVGGSPVMADYYGESAEITSVADALNINMGTLNPDRLKAMLISGRCANKKGGRGRVRVPPQSGGRAYERGQIRRYQG